MQTSILDLSPLSLPLQQEVIDFYEFLLEKQAKNSGTNTLKENLMKRPIKIALSLKELLLGWIKLEC